MESQPQNPELRNNPENFLHREMDRKIPPKFHGVSSRGLTNGDKM